MMKSWKLAPLALVAALLLSTPARTLAVAACGDINNDGAVNSNDSVCMAGCVAGNGVCPAPATLPQCGPGPVCMTGNLADCGDIVKDGITILPQIQSDLNNLSLSLVGIETLYGLCSAGRAGGSDSCPNKIGHCSGDNQTACTVAQDCVDQGTTGPCVAGCGSGSTVTYQSFTIDETTGWPPAPGCTVKLNGTVFVQTNPGAAVSTVLCIEKGTLVQGIKGSPDPSALIFLATDDGGDPDIPDRKAKIDAQGTAAQPIVYTSDQAPGARSRGDWAGVVFNGLSTVNRNFAIGKCFGQGEGIPTPFGGCKENDSSGIATYNRVAYAGLVFTPNNELNLWTMNGLGRRTRFDHLQANVGADDCFEWFGGTVNADHLVASGCGDDGLDFQLGYTGAVQYALYLQNGTTMDSTQRDSRGIESDNSEFGNNDLPRSNPVFCNITLVGSKDDGDDGGSDVGIMHRRGVAGKFANMIVTGHQDAGVELRDLATTQMACDNPTTLNTDEPTLRIKNSMFYNNGTSHGGAEHCKHDVCRNAAGANANSLCTGSTTPYACCTGSGTGTCDVSCDLTSECVAGAPDGTFTFCNINGNCSSCDWYEQLVATEGVVNDNASNAMNPGVGTAYPAVGDLYDGRPSGTLISPTTCSNLADGLEDATYIGAFDPSASCDVTNGPCDWLSEPWIDFAIN